MYLLSEETPPAVSELCSLPAARSLTPSLRPSHSPTPQDDRWLGTEPGPSYHVTWTSCLVLHFSLSHSFLIWIFLTLNHGVGGVWFLPRQYLNLLRNLLLCFG